MVSEADRNCSPGYSWPPHLYQEQVKSRRAREKKRVEFRGPRTPEARGDGLAWRSAVRREKHTLRGDDEALLPRKGARGRDCCFPAKDARAQGTARGRRNLPGRRDIH